MTIWQRFRRIGRELRGWDRRTDADLERAVAAGLEYWGPTLYGLGIWLRGLALFAVIALFIGIHAGHADLIPWDPAREWHTLLGFAIIMLTAQNLAHTAVVRRRSWAFGFLLGIVPSIGIPIAIGATGAGGDCGACPWGDLQGGVAGILLAYILMFIIPRGKGTVQ